MKTNAIEYLESVNRRRYMGNLSKIKQGLSLYRLLEKDKQKVKILNRDGFAIAVCDRKSSYEKRKRSRMGWECKN